MTKDLIQEILRHVQSNVVGGLLKEDGTPDTNSIKRSIHNSILYHLFIYLSALRYYDIGTYFIKFFYKHSK